MPASSASLAMSRKFLSFLVVMNWAAGLFIVGLLTAALIAPVEVLGALGFESARWSGSIRAVIVMIMVIGISAVPITHVILRRMRDIVDTVSVGDPFHSANAMRLKTIAWAVLALNLMHVLYAVLAVGAGLTRDGLRLDFSVTRWLSVLLIFVLARVFQEGADMREELEGTI